MLDPHHNVKNLIIQCQRLNTCEDKLKIITGQIKANKRDFQDIESQLLQHTNNMPKQSIRGICDE